VASAFAGALRPIFVGEMQSIGYVLHVIAKLD
jgi:hypothetical protein